MPDAPSSRSSTGRSYAVGFRRSAWEDDAEDRAPDGVYDADGTLRGELAYVVGRRLGRRHCGLCDITHGRVRERAEWRAARDRLGVPFEAVHLDERPADVREATGGRAPVVVAHLDGGGTTLLLGPEDIDARAGDAEALVERIRDALRRGGWVPDAWT